MYSPLLDPSPPLGVGLLAMLVLVAWAMSSVPQSRRLTALRVIATHVGVTTGVLAGVTIWVGRSVRPDANPFIGRVVQIFVSVAMVALVSVIAAARIRDLVPTGDAGPAKGYREPANGGARPAGGAPTTTRTRQTPGAIVVLGFAGVIALLFAFFWLVLSRAG